MSKVIFSISYAGLTLPVVQNAQGKDCTPLKPISDLFGFKWEEQRKKVTNGEYLSRYLGTCTLDIRGAGDQNREQTCILLKRVAAYLMGINPDKVRAAGNVGGAKFLEEKQEEWADALHDYEEIGFAANLNHERHQELIRKKRMALVSLIGAKNRTAGAGDRGVLTCSIAALAAELGIPYQPDLEPSTSVGSGQ